jgi:hypothetical protein
MGSSRLTSSHRLVFTAVFLPAARILTTPHLSQNTLLKIFGVFLLCVMLLTLLWAQSAEAAGARRTQALEEQIMAKNSERFDEIRRTKGAIESQAFAKQNLRALRQMKVGTSKMFRLLSAYEDKGGGKNQNSKLMLLHARTYLKNMMEVVDADTAESSDKFNEAASKTKEVLVKATSAEAAAKVAANSLWKKGSRVKTSEKAKEWMSKKKVVDNTEDLPAFARPPMPPPVKASAEKLKVKLPSFKEVLASGKIAAAKKAAMKKRESMRKKVPRTGGTKADQKKSMLQRKEEMKKIWKKNHGHGTQREKMKGVNLDLQKKLHSLFVHAKTQKLLDIPAYNIHKWEDIRQGYTELLKLDVSKPDVQKRMSDYEEKMKKLIVMPERAKANPKKWETTMNDKTFRVFNAQMRMASFGETQKTIADIEKRLTASKISTVVAWKEVMQLMHSGKVPPGWTMDHQMVHSVLKPDAKSSSERH